MNIYNLRMNQLCKVCSEPAAGFHFGAFTCEGCKSFFGRTYNNLSQIHECKNGGQCIINKQNRTSCKACRLRKCLLVGMSKSGSRYGRRSNWFKIHCALQEQAANMNRGLDGGGGVGGVGNSLNLQLGASSANMPRLSPSTCTEDEGKLGSPALSSPDSNTSETSIDIEPRRSLSGSSLQSTKSQLSLAEHEALVARELNKSTNNALATVGGRGLGPPMPGADFVAGLSLYDIHSRFSLLQAQIYQRLYPPLLYPSMRPALESIPQPHESNSPNNCLSLTNIGRPLNPPSPANSLPPPCTKREQLSNPPSPQSLPAQSFSDHAAHSPASSSSSPPLQLLTSRKRAADSPPVQEAPIDLSVKRPRFTSGNEHPLPDLTPIPMPFSFLHLPPSVASGPPPVPVDLTSNA